MPIKEAVKPQPEPLPGESRASNPRATIGDNRPPLDEEAKAAFREELLRDRPDFDMKVEEIIDASARVSVVDDDSYGKVGQFVKRCRAAEQHIADAHKTAKQPYLDAGRAVDAAKNELTSRITTVKDDAQAKMNSYATKKAAEERAERERAEAAAREAAAAAEAAGEGEVAELAAATPKKSGPFRADTATISIVEVWNSEVTDYTKAFKAVKSDPKVKAEIDAAIKRLVKAGMRDIAGVRVWPTQQAVAR